ncbi:hypothetical protein HKX48_003192, partial [Thoreauomyces humboldtii]
AAIVGGAVGGATAVASVAGIAAFAKYGRSKDKVLNAYPSASELRMAQENPLYVSPAPMTENPIYEVEYEEKQWSGRRD